MNKELTPKQLKFCKEYLIDLNGRQAAIRAGYSEKTANEIASENLTKPNIQHYIAEQKEKRNNILEINGLAVLKELRNFAFSDVTELMDVDFAKIKELPPEVRRLITSFKKTVTHGDTYTNTTYDIKFVDKLKAFEMLNKHIGFYEKDNHQKKEITVNNNLTTMSTEDLKAIAEIKNKYKKDV